MSLTPREIGTLIVVVLKANHLPNKRHIGKQDPYCVVTVNGEKRRTKAIKRGGQHPEWDEEIRFTLFEDTDDVLARTARKDGSPPPLPPKNGSPVKRVKGGKLMKLACYADDSREPDLIGEADVDLTEVLTKGETDEWFTLTNKDKFAGKVYLELTFWSNEPAPEKKVTPKPAKNNKQYGGPGMFVPSGEKPRHPPRSTSLGGNYGPQPDLYVAPYEQHAQQNPVDNLAQEFSEFNVGQHRRESFPPVSAAYNHHPQGSYGSHFGDGSVGYGYDVATSPPSQSSGFYGAYNAQPAYPNLYETQSSIQYQPTIRGPRHSVPTASSGFMPLGQPSGFAPVQPPPESYPPLTHAPAPVAYTSHPTQPYLPQQPYQPSSAPSQADAYLPGSPSALSYQAQYTYPQYAVPSNVPAPQQQYVPHQPPLVPAVDPGATVGQPYQSYPPQTVHQDNLPPPPNPPTVVGGSRPLPPQPIVYTQSIPPQVDSPQRVTSYSSPVPPENVTPGLPASSHPFPAPPPPPPLSYGTEPQNFSPNGAQVAPLPPPPPPELVNGRARRQSGLPQPPINVQQHIPPYPPPPPPPLNAGQSDYMYNQLPPPPPPPAIAHNGVGHNTYQGVRPPLPPPPPPKPPVQAGEQAHWQSYNTQ